MVLFIKRFNDKVSARANDQINAIILENLPPEEAKFIYFNLTKAQENKNFSNPSGIIKTY